MKTKSFYFHYNKPASRKAGKPVMTLHYNKTCYPVNAITCRVATETHERKSQPRMVIRGRANEILFSSDTCSVKAIII